MQAIPAALVQGLKEGSMGLALRKHQPEFPHLDGVRLALIGVGKGANAVRQQLYPLQWHFGSLKMADLGNLRPGNDGAATAAGLAEVLSELHELQITAVVIGDDALLRSAQYLALRHASTPIEFAMVLPGLDPEADAGLQRILQHQPSFLFNLSFYATQAYFVTEPAIDWLEAGHYEHHRLGVLREKREEAEPGLRRLCAIRMRPICLWFQPMDCMPKKPLPWRVMPASPPTCRVSCSMAVRLNTPCLRRLLRKWPGTSFQDIPNATRNNPVKMIPISWSTEP